MMKILFWPVSSFWCLPYSGSAFNCPDPTFDDHDGDDDGKDAILWMIIPVWTNDLAIISSVKCY